MSDYGAPRVDLTPLDLYLRGVVILPHKLAGHWCYHRRNRYGAGDVYGTPNARVEDAVAEARHDARPNAGQMMLGGL